MEKHFICFIFAGLIVLFISGCFYLIYRPESLFIIALVNEAPLSFSAFQFPGTGVLPSFLHTLSFCLLSTAFVRLERINIVIFGVFWFLIHLVYEVFSASDYAKNLVMLFYGDPYDVISSFFGMVTFMAFAFLVLGKIKHT